MMIEKPFRGIVAASRFEEYGQYVQAAGCCRRSYSRKPSVRSAT